MLLSKKNKSPISSIFFFLILSLFSIIPSVSIGDSDNYKAVKYQRVFPGITSTQPTLLLQRPGDNNRFYIIEKAGRIFYFSNRQDVSKKHLYLDISKQKVDESYEGGLLGMAFDPDFDSNHYVYLSYTTSDEPEKDNSQHLQSRISRLTVNQDNTTILPESEVVLLEIEQPWNNHNGGHIAFGPEGYLYAGYGDGGSWGDPNRNAQNTKTLLGSILRINVRSTEVKQPQGEKYSIPVDNPFSQNKDCSTGKGCPELYAWGLRNPWRWSFDKSTGNLWAGDVGQGEWEEIDLITKGGNYGWNCYEGNADYRLKLCDKKLAYTSPVFEYSHMPSDSSRDGMAASITGGYVYRGQEVPALKGAYIFADYIHGKIWILPDPYRKTTNSIELFDTDFFIPTFAEDNQGEIYFLNYFGEGGIYRFF